MPGLLRIRGEIDPSQFWPDGTSDADTSKVKVHVGADSFAFAADGRRFRVTRVFDDASVVGASREPVIDTKQRITVRLQGIDAPELHYRAPALKRSRRDVTESKRSAYNQLNRVERRQYWAESATVALARELGRHGGARIACEVYSAIEAPREVVDTYGRFIGNIRVGRRPVVDVNVWLTRQGWVFPTFYSSMTGEEIEALQVAATAGRARGRVWSALSGNTSLFRASLHYRPGGPVDADADQRAPVLMPKLYRRQVAFRMEKAAGIFGGRFREFLERSPDPCYETDDFLAAGPHSATTRTLAEFMEGARFAREPEELVFREKFSDLVGPGGARIETF